MNRPEQFKLNRIQGENLASMHEVSPEVVEDLGYTTPENGYAKQIASIELVSALMIEHAVQNPDARVMPLDPSSVINDAGRENIRNGIARIRRHLDGEA